MKVFLLYAAGVGIAVVIGIGVIYGLRLFTTASTPITVHEVRPGVFCALATTSDGAAISCWRDR